MRFGGGIILNNYGKKICRLSDCSDDFQRVRWCFHIQRTTRNDEIRSLAAKKELDLCRRNPSLLNYVLNLRHYYSWKKGLFVLAPNCFGEPVMLRKVNLHLERKR